jgi:TonB-dependent SusC/RagA subfamily outer membrane receptor
VLGVSALVFAVGCSSAPSQRPGTGSAPVRDGEDVQSRSTGVLVTKVNGVLKVSLLAGNNNSFGATTYTPSNGTDMAPAKPVNVGLAGSEPLFLLNGTPYTPGPGGLLIGIEAHDIVSIKAVKDPAELSLYGMRGGNGVISITTKQPGAPRDTTKK